MTACASILCDACGNPGRCCTGFHLRDFPADATALDVMTFCAKVVHGQVRETGWPVMLPARISQASLEDFEHVQIGLPFMPLWRTPGGTWRFWCPELVDGRCSIYEHRPALCRHYKAGSDGLCCMHHPGPKEPVWAAVVEDDPFPAQEPPMSGNTPEPPPKVPSFPKLFGMERSGRFLAFTVIIVSFTVLIGLAWWSGAIGAPDFVTSQERPHGP